ncbi:SCN9A [Symbiodinium necroappetens]|uniref:SCN9A protein n=1 Tax=Symbiodinium necroappetens TaxID=1628268 RepID=A0A813CEF0_9DINO|nr:SCN9A [Symbiodinium necroappetens]
MFGFRGAADGANSCIKNFTTYYDDSTPPVDVGYSDSAVQCQAACAQQAGCDAWTYLSDSQVCWQLPMTPELVLIGNKFGTSGLKNCAPSAAVKAKAALVAEATVTRAPVLYEGGLRPKCSFRGKAFFDSSVKVMNGGAVGSPQDCATSCNSQPTCQFWTFYNNTGACWLQGSNVTQHESEFAVSGPKLCAQAVESDRYESGHNITRAGQLVMMRSIPRPSCSNRGQAYQHATMKTPTYVADANACQYSCQTLSFCTRFTYYINSKGCWLLDDNVTTFASDMAISGPKACSKPIVKELEPAATPGLRATLETGHAQDACKRIGLAYLGNLVSSMVATSSSECQQRCRTSRACDVFTYRLDSNRCLLHGSRAMEQQHPHAVSGPKACLEEFQMLASLPEKARVSASSGKHLHDDQSQAEPGRRLSHLSLASFGLAALVTLSLVVGRLQAGTWADRHADQTELSLLDPDQAVDEVGAEFAAALRCCRSAWPETRGPSLSKVDGGAAAMAPDIHMTDLEQRLPGKDNLMWSSSFWSGVLPGHRCRMTFYDAYLDVLDKAKQDANYWAVRALCQWKVITEATVHGKELRLVKVSCGFFREASEIPMFERFRYRMLWLVEWRQLLACPIVMAHPVAYDEASQPRGVQNTYFVFETLVSVDRAELMPGDAPNPCYLKEPSNWIDMMVVIFTFVEPFAAEVISEQDLRTMRVLRIFRVFRVIRGMTFLPRLRTIVQALSKSLYRLWISSLAITFTLIVVSMAGTDLFGDVYWRRCRLSEEPYLVNGTLVWPLDPSQPRFCGGRYECVPTTSGAPTYCRSPVSTDTGPLPGYNPWPELFENPLADYGFTGYQTLWSGLLTTFQVVNIDGWVSLMHRFEEPSAAELRRPCFTKKRIFKQEGELPVAYREACNAWRCPEMARDNSGLILMNLVLAILWHSFDTTVQEDRSELGDSKLKMEANLAGTSYSGRKA